MHGIQNFPTPIEGHSLYEFKKLVENYKIFDVSFGYSDHIESNNILSSILPMIAFSLGASIIEKHFTDDLKKELIIILQWINIKLNYLLRTSML